MGLTAQYIVVGAIIAVVAVLIVVRAVNLRKNAGACTNCSLRGRCGSKPPRKREKCCEEAKNSAE